TPSSSCEEMFDSRSSLEVLLVPEDQAGDQLADLRKAQMCPAGSLLCCLGGSGQLMLWAPGDRRAPRCSADEMFCRPSAGGDQREEPHWSWLLQLQWERESGEAKMISCHHLQPISRTQHAAVQLCGETLFTLSSDGLIHVFAVTDGALLASINLPAYLEDDLSSSSPSSSFCLVQVSADLSTAVAVTQSHAAVAVDLNHYFRLHPDHLLCVGPQSNVPLQHKDHRDQDSLSSSSHCLAALGSALCDDRSWKTRLALMCSRAQQVASPSPPSKPAERPWFYSLPHLQASSASASSQSRAPPGGAVVHFSVPETSTPSLLAVSEFSALLTFVTPGNTQTTVALWDMESGSLSYHQSEDVAVPVQHSGERQQRLLLKSKLSVFQVMFSMPQQDLLSRLMLFGSAATVDAVCKLNSWGHCSIPFHALQAGLKNRQLDTVDLYLKSKENLLNSSASVCVSEQSADSKQSLKDSMYELFLALDLLCSTVRDLNSEAQSRQFSEQLLNLTLSFINTQIRENSDVLNSVKILDTYVTELRNYLKRFPWSSGSSTSNSGAAPPREVEGDEWEKLTTEEVIYQAVLTNQIPRAQAVMWRLNRPEQHLSALRMVGLNHVLSCLQSGNLQTAKTLLTNMVGTYSNRKRTLFYVWDPQLIRFKCSRVPQIAHDELEGRELLEELVEQRSPEEVGELWRNIQLHWVKNWDHDCQTAVLLSRLQHTELSLGDSSVLWRYLTSLHDKQQVVEWIHNQRSSDSLCWPDITPEVVSSSTACSIFFKENVLDLLARKAVFIPEEMSDLEQLLWRLAQVVELLIVAHSCFSLTCNMEGIVRVLQAARHLSHTYLAPGEHYSLMVRLLTGIGRYNEMTYIFDLLHQSHRFEMLLRKKVETERGQTALLDYIKRCLPADSEKHNMVALCFSMRREIGENHEIAARTQLKMIESQDWVVTPELKSSLMKVLGLLKDAAESFSKDSCVRQASRCINQAKLITLQLHLLNQGSNLRIINLKPTELHAAFMALPRCYQVFVVSEAYSYNPDWAEILYQKVVLKGDFVYLEELKGLRPLTSAIFEDIFRKVCPVKNAGVSSNVKRLLTHCDDVYTRYRLAYQQNLYDVTKTLLQDNKTASYMNDRLSNKAFI
uniref:Spatacsin C-terminal domain-containing protein n=1 Tax=Cyprinodon variegatus TaxID=28743 RepID=A0A3Q2FDS2_CYPVA